MGYLKYAASTIPGAANCPIILYADAGRTERIEVVLEEENGHCGSDYLKLNTNNQGVYPTFYVDEKYQSVYAYCNGSLTKLQSTNFSTEQEAYLNGAFASFGLTRYGRVPGWAGDSMTVGAGSSNAPTSSFVAMVPKILGGAACSALGYNGGVTGDTSAMLLARMDTILAQSPEVVHVQIGANDAGQDVPVATFAANIIAIRAKCDRAGVPMTIGTVAPRDSTAGTTVRDLITSYNLWLRAWCLRAGVPLAPVHAALVDATTGYLHASYDSGDGTHPNDAGHLAMASAIAATMATVLPARPWPVYSAGLGLIDDPLMAVSGNGTLGVNGAATASLVAASNGDLPYGGWKRFTVANGTGATAYIDAVAKGVTAFSPGDVMLVAMYLRGSTAAALNKVSIRNQSGTIRNVIFEASPSATPGPILKTVTATAGDTNFGVYWTAAVPASSSVTFDIGAFDIFNLTALGLASLVTF